ncbi:hypothetical protein DFH11DRAFT_258656 [Phellopilus nigrolimitatus]|nr:hypothetical protein DFH11DRAFT_258656 [Phellopilus nigrolimitatus]
MVFLRGFAPTLSLVLSLVPPVNDDRALHVRQSGYVDKYDFDTSYSFAQTLYGAQSFKNHAVLDLATQSVNADFLSTLFQCGGEDLATSLGSTPAPSSTLASDYAPRHPEYTPYDNIGQAFATPACFSSPPVIELLELPESVDEHFAHGNYTSITVSEDAGMGIPAGVADVEKAYAAYVEQPMAPRCLMLHRPTPCRPIPRRRPQRSLRTLSHTREMPPRTPTPSWSLRPPTSSRPSKSQARTQSSRRHCKSSHSLQGSEKLLTNSLQLEYIL